MAGRARAQAQLGFDETAVDDAELLEALEDRASRKASLDAVRLEYKAADDRARARLEEHDALVDVDHPLRVGRWRITRVARASRTVHFETKPSTSIRIEEAGDGEEAASPVRLVPAQAGELLEDQGEMAAGPADRLN